MTDPVIYRQDGGVVTLTLNEPETRNAISPAIVEALVAACARINGDMGVGCVVLTGAGKSFSSGGNVKEMRDKAGLFGGTPAEIRRAYLHGIQRVPLALYDLETPVIAAVNGHAVGAGCDLTLMCDIRIAAEDAQFAESFMRVGLVSGDGVVREASGTVHRQLTRPRRVRRRPSRRPPARPRAGRAPASGPACGKGLGGHALTKSQPAGRSRM